MKKIKLLFFVLIIYFGLINITYARSVSCTYGEDNGIQVWVGFDENGEPIKEKIDKNVAIYTFDSISLSNFINANNEYYCPDKITYVQLYNPESRRNNYDFSFFSSLDYPSNLTLTDSKIDNSGTTAREFDHACEYGTDKKYVINYYKDGIIEAAGSYRIYNDIPYLEEGCLQAVYLCGGEIICKIPHWDNNNCLKLLNTNSNSLNQPGNNKPTTSENETASCESLLGDPIDPKAPAYWFQMILDIMKYAAIVALLILSTMDFIKASVESDKEALKKAVVKAGKRFVYAVLIFFLPIIVNVLMKLLGVYGTCGLR